MSFLASSLRTWGVGFQAERFQFMVSRAWNFRVGVEVSVLGWCTGTPIIGVGFLDSHGLELSSKPFENQAGFAYTCEP